MNPTLKCTLKCKQRKEESVRKIISEALYGMDYNDMIGRAKAEVDKIQRQIYKRLRKKLSLIVEGDDKILKQEFGIEEEKKGEDSDDPFEESAHSPAAGNY